MYSLYKDGDVLIVECNNPNGIVQGWPLCSQAVYLSASKALIRTDASEDTWRPLLDKLLAEDPESAITRLRWKPSRNGGRPWLVPGATATKLAASRRRKGRTDDGTCQSHHFTEVRVNGEVGREDGEVMRKIIGHLTSHSPLQCTETPPDRAPRPGEWIHLASRDSGAAPGRVRLHLQSQEEVQKVYEALHGQILQVGTDQLAITVHNDVSDAGSSKNGGGGRPNHPLSWRCLRAASIGDPLFRNSHRQLHGILLLALGCRLRAPLIDWAELSVPQPCQWRLHFVLRQSCSSLSPPSMA